MPTPIDKNHDEIKKDPPEFPVDDPSDDEEEEGEEEEQEEKEKEEAPEEAPAWAKGISENVSKLNKRLDGIDKKIEASEPPTGDGKEGEFKPNYEKGEYFPPGYKPSSYNEFAKKMLDINDNRSAHQKSVQTKQEKDWNDQWDKQLDQLTADKKIPEVKDPNDPKDPGRKARAQLLIDASNAGSSDLVSFYNVTSKYKKGKPKAPPSAAAPVGGESGGEGGGKPKRTYSDTKKPIEQVIQEKYPDIAGS